MKYQISFIQEIGDFPTYPFYKCTRIVLELLHYMSENKKHCRLLECFIGHFHKQNHIHLIRVFYEHHKRTEY